MQKGFSTIILLIAFLVIVAAGGAYYFSSMSAQPVPTQVSQPVKVSTPDEIANWKTYENTKYGYSIKYPTDNLLQLICPNEELDLQVKATGNNEIVETPDSCGRDGRFDIEVQTYVNPTKVQVSDENYTVTKESITVANQVADKYIIVPTDNCFGMCTPEWREEIRITKNGKLYTLNLWKKDLSSTFDQMVSTFKFTDQGSTVNLSSWKTYTGQYVTFQHPTSWTPKEGTVCCGAVLENISLGIPGNPVDETVGFSTPSIDSLKPNDTVTEEKIEISGQPGFSWFRKSNGLVSYDYCTAGHYKDAGSFCLNVTLKAEDQNLKTQLDQVVNSIKFTN